VVINVVVVVLGLVVLVLLLVVGATSLTKAQDSDVSNRIGMKFGATISRRKVLPPGESTRSVCAAYMLSSVQQYILPGIVVSKYITEY